MKKFIIAGAVCLTFSFLIAFPVEAKWFIRPSLSKSWIVSPELFLKDGLVGYWTLDTKDIVSNVADLSGNNNTGYIIKPSGTATTSVLITGKLNTAFDGDGVTGANARYVQVARATSLNPSAAVTLCAWVYPTSGSNTGIVHKGTLSNGQPDYGFVMQSSNRVMWRLNGAGSDVNSTNNSVPNTTWTHVCGTYDKVTQIIYINGAYNASKSFTTSITDTANSGVYIGAYYSTSYTFNGDIDEVRIYKRALSASEINQLYTLRRANSIIRITNT